MRMVEAASSTVGSPEVGTAEDWIIEPAGEWVVEGIGLRGWSREYVEASGDAVFATESDAQAALDDLVRRQGWQRDELRVRRLPA